MLYLLSKLKIVCCTDIASPSEPNTHIKISKFVLYSTVLIAVALFGIFYDNTNGAIIGLVGCSSYFLIYVVLNSFY